MKLGMEATHPSEPDSQQQLAKIDRQIAELEAHRQQIATQDEQQRREKASRQEELILFRLSHQTPNRLETLKSELSLDLIPRIQELFFDFDGQGEARIDSLEQSLANEHSQNQSRQEQIIKTISRRLAEINQLPEGETEYETERDILARLWYQHQADKFTKQARFHRTSFELGRIYLLTRPDFSDSQSIESFEDRISRLGKDEYRADVTQRQIQELTLYHDYYGQVVGASADSDQRLVAQKSLQAQLRHSQSPNVVQISPNYPNLKDSLEWAGKLLEAWDPQSSPEAIAQGLFNQVHNGLQKDAMMANKEIAADLEQIHQTITGRSHNLTQPLGKELMRLASN